VVYPDFETLRESDTGTALIGWTNGDARIAIETREGASTSSVGTMFVTANYFRTLGVPLARGAGFDATGDNPRRPNRRDCRDTTTGRTRWVAERDIIGKTLTLDGIPHVVVGVAPEHFLRSHGLSGATTLSPARTVSAAADRHDASFRPG
jgi:hypothetical protein